MTTTQKRISEIVEEYKEVFPDEYVKFCQAISVKRHLQKNDLASTGGDNYLQQLAYEVPLTLHTMFGDMLIEEEEVYLKSRDGALWFGRTFKEFSPAKDL